MIRKSFTALFLVLALVYATTVPAQERTPAVTTETSTQDILYAQYQTQFEAEFTAYAATHTEAEVQAYFQQRINQMTSEALTLDGTTTQGAAIALDGSAEVMPGDISFILTCGTMMMAALTLACAFVWIREMRNAATTTTQNWHSQLSRPLP